MTRLICILMLGLNPCSFLAYGAMIQTYITSSVPAGPGDTTDTVEILIDHAQAPQHELTKPPPTGRVTLRAQTTGAIWTDILDYVEITGLDPDKEYTWTELIAAANLPMTVKTTVTRTAYVGLTGNLNIRTSTLGGGKSINVSIPSGHYQGGAVAQCSFSVPGDALTMDHGALMLRRGEESTRTTDITAACNTSVVAKRFSVFGGSYKYLQQGDLLSVLLVNGQESYTDYGMTSTVTITSTLQRVDEQFAGGPISDARIVLVEVI